MGLQCLLLLSLLAVCFLLACCAPQGAASWKWSALLALESHIQELAGPREELREAADKAEPESCARSPKETRSSLIQGGSSKARPPAAALRKRITPYQSRKIAARQQFRCAVCREPFSEGNLWDIDHVVPLHLCGGSKEECNDMSNLRAIHRTCHMDVTAEQFARPKKP